MRDGASMPSLSPDVVRRVLRACLRGDVEAARGYPERQPTTDGEPHAIEARCSMLGNDNEALLSAARVGLENRARGDSLMMNDIDAGNPTSGLPRRCRLTPER
ncbi:hypothetical protein KPA96_32015 [Burkholderia cenocepacia]|uniref:CUE domain-containing protein n=1 Tax=Burkholderia cenocepacia TaxID=95486 RepID=UPI00286640BC|nr:CUE domain-containing protein [Burkholderia cenocepacia]MDR8080263.1 hypothetical protein [Burkholderia cenocepacia]